MNTLELAKLKQYLLQEIGNNPYNFSVYKGSMGYGKTTYVFNTNTKDNDADYNDTEKKEILVGDNLDVKPDESSLVNGPFGIKGYYIGNTLISIFEEGNTLVELLVTKKSGNKITVKDKNDPVIKYVLDIDEVNKKIKGGEITVYKGKSSTNYFVTIMADEDVKDPFPEDPNNPDMLPTLDISFGTGPTPNNADLTNLTNKGEAIRVMSTVAAIIRAELRKYPNVQVITFSPARTPNKDGEDDGDNSRARVYLGLIRSEFGVKDLNDPLGPVKVKKDDTSESFYIVKFDRDYLDKYLSTKS